MTDMIKECTERGHVMRHEDSPTWCIHCGTFDIYCGYSDCTDAPAGNFDSGKPQVFKRMYEDLFGLTPAAASIGENDAVVAARKEESEGKSHD